MSLLKISNTLLILINTTKQNQKHLLSTKHDSEAFENHNLNPQNSRDMSLQSLFYRLENWSWIVYTMPQGFELQAQDSNSVSLTPKHKLLALSILQKANISLHHQSSIDTEKCSETLQKCLFYTLF